jgi:hypothetical protein
MAKEEDQTQQTEEEQVDATAAEEATATAAAVKTSEDFDKLQDEEDVEETPSDAESDDKSEAEEKDDSEADEKPAGEEEPEEKDEEKDATDTGESPISKELAQRALDLGLSEEEAIVLDGKGEGALGAMLDTMESIMADDEKAAGAQAAAETKTDTKKDEVKGFELKFENEEDIDPELLGNIKGMKAYYEREMAALVENNKKLGEKVDGLIGGIEEQERQQFVKRFDGMVDGLGLEFADTFGKGSTNDLGRRSKAFKNRDSVRGRMHAIAKGMADTGQEIPDEKVLFDLSMNSLFKTKMDTGASSRLHKKTTARGKQRIGRPATKKTGSMTGEQKAIETSRKFDELIDTTED